jgi:hypothetical protein
MLIEYFRSSIAFHVAVLNFAETTLHVQWLHKLHFRVPPDNKIGEGALNPGSYETGQRILTLQSQNITSREFLTNFHNFICFLLL